MRIHDVTGHGQNKIDLKITFRDQNSFPIHYSDVLLYHVTCFIETTVS